MIETGQVVKREADPSSSVTPDGAAGPGSMPAASEMDPGHALAGFPG